MKKGLLSLLAVALTVVGCQNYDDQFDDLKTQITDLATTVAGLTQVQSDLTQLATTVASLRTAVDAIPTNPATASDLQPLSDALAAAQADIDSLEALLNSNQALTQTQLGQISTTLAAVQADVQTLLQGDSVISPASGAIIINNEATLVAAENLVPSDADAGSLVLDGSLYVIFTNPGLTTAAQMTRVNDVLAKFVSVIGEVNIINSQPAAVTTGVTADGLVSVSQNVSLTGTGAVGPSLNGLTSVGETLELNTTGAGSLNAIVSVGGDLNMRSANIPTLNTLTTVGGDFDRGSGSAPAVAALSTIGDDLIAAHTGDWNYSQVTSVGGNVVVGQGATSVDLSDVTVGGTIRSDAPGATAGQLIMSTATTTGRINIGSASIELITADGASEIIGTSTSISTLTVNADAATHIRFNGATSATATGNIEINTTSQTIVEFTSLVTAGGIDINDAAEAQFDALTSAGNINIDVEDETDLRAFTSGGGTTPSIGGDDVNLAALVSIASTQTFTLPDATTLTSGNLKLLSTGGSLVANSVLSIGVVTLDNSKLTANGATSLTVSAQEADLTIANGDYSALRTLSVSGKQEDPGAVADVSDVDDLTITSSTDTLTTVTVGGEFREVTINSTSITDVTTSGEITDLDITGANIDDITIGHTYLPYDTAATIAVQNTDIADLDMSSVGKVKSITLTGNDNLASLDAPSSTVLAEPAAVIAVTLGTNSFTANYTDGVVASETENSALPSISSPEIHKLINWIEAADAVSTLGTINIDIERVTQGATTVSIAAAFLADASTATSTTYTGTISRQEEFDLIGD